MKKRIIVLICIVVLSALVLCPLSACSAKDDGKLKVVCSSFPLYDWAVNVIGSRAGMVSVTLLQDSGADLHSYQPTVSDLAAIAKADVFVFVGGESDEWVKDALKSVKNKKVIKVDLMEILGDKALAEELVEGMQDEDLDHDSDHEHADGDDHDHDDAELDEHVWLSLKNAELFTVAIARALSSADGEGKEVYEANAKAYIASLAALDEEYSRAVEAAPRKTLLFADRFPFRYLTEDYGLSYYAAFKGCSSEASASFETVLKLAGIVDALGLKVILKLENSDSDTATSVRGNTRAKNQKIMVLDSLQSASKKEYENGRNYLSVMAKNLEVIKEALAE